MTLQVAKYHVNTDPVSNSLQNVCIFFFPQCTVPQINDHRFLWGRTRRTITVHSLSWYKTWLYDCLSTLAYSRKPPLNFFVMLVVLSPVHSSWMMWLLSPSMEYNSLVCLLASHDISITTCPLLLAFLFSFSTVCQVNSDISILPKKDQHFLQTSECYPINEFALPLGPLTECYIPCFEKVTLSQWILTYPVLSPSPIQQLADNPSSTVLRNVLSHKIN